MASRKQKQRQSRRQKQSRKQKSQQQQGGARRKTRKVGRKASSWAQAVGKMYRQMKEKDAGVTLADAMQAASKARAAGKL